MACGFTDDTDVTDSGLSSGLFGTVTTLDQNGNPNWSKWYQSGGSFSPFSSVETCQYTPTEGFIVTTQRSHDSIMKINVITGTLLSVVYIEEDTVPAAIATSRFTSPYTFISDNVFALPYRSNEGPVLLVFDWATSTPTMEGVFYEELSA